MMIYRLILLASMAATITQAKDGSVCLRSANAKGQVCHSIYTRSNPDTALGSVCLSLNDNNEIDVTVNTLEDTGDLIIRIRDCGWGKITRISL